MCWCVLLCVGCIVLGLCYVMLLFWACFFDVMEKNQILKISLTKAACLCWCVGAGVGCYGSVCWFSVVLGLPVFFKHRY